MEVPSPSFALGASSRTRKRSEDSDSTGSSTGKSSDEAFGKTQIRTRLKPIRRGPLASDKEAPPRSGTKGRAYIPPKRRPNHNTATLKVFNKWLVEHWHHPYPDKATRSVLARTCGIEAVQVSHWFANARARIWKPDMKAQIPSDILKSLNMEGYKHTMPGDGDEDSGARAPEGEQTPAGAALSLLSLPDAKIPNRGRLRSRKKASPEAAKSPTSRKRTRPNPAQSSGLDALAAVVCAGGLDGF